MGRGNDRVGPVRSLAYQKQFSGGGQMSQSHSPRVLCWSTTTAASKIAPRTRYW